MIGKHKHRNMDNKEKLTEEEIKNQTEQQNGEEQNLQNVDIKEEDSQTEEEKQSDDNNNGADNEEVLDPLAKAEAEIAELKDKYLRSVAEFDNYRKRTMKEKAELILNGSEKTITAILPIVDDMERAMANVEKANDMEAVKEGMELKGDIISEKLTIDNKEVLVKDTKELAISEDFGLTAVAIQNLKDSANNISIVNYLLGSVPHFHHP
jgi:molecular chaperone GrpE